MTEQWQLRNAFRIGSDWYGLWRSRPDVKAADYLTACADEALRRYPDEPTASEGGKMPSPEFTIEDKLRHMIARSLDIADLYKTALGTIVEQRSCIEDWQRRSQLWCSKCDKANALEECERKCQELIARLADQRAETAKAKKEQAYESGGETDEEFEKRVCRDAFLDGANWLENRLRDKPLSAYYTRMAWEEACKRWGEEGRDEQS